MGLLFIAIAMMGCDNTTTGTDGGTGTDSGGGDSAVVDSGPVTDEDGGPGEDGGPVVDGGPVEIDGGGDPGADGGPVEAAINGCTRATATDLTGLTATSIAFGGALGHIYDPKCIVVDVGTTVTFEGAFSMHPLQAGTVEGLVLTPQTTGTPLPTTPRATGAMAAFVMAETGAFGFYCVPHATAGMNGAIFVE